MPFPAYVPPFDKTESEDEAFLRMQEEARLREQQAQPGFLETLGKTPLGKEIVSLGADIGSVAKGIYGLSPVPLIQEYIANPELWRDPAIAERRDLISANAALKDKKIKAGEGPEANAAKMVAAGAAAGMPTPTAPVAAPSRSVMNVTIGGKTYDYTDPNVRAPKLTGDRVALRERGPGSMLAAYDPSTGGTTMVPRIPEVATVPADKRPGVSTMENVGLRQELADLARRRVLGEARYGAAAAELTPRERLQYDPKYAAEVEKLRRPSDVQLAGQEFRKLYQDSFLAGEQAVVRALQQDPTLFQVYQNAQKGDQKANIAFREQAKKIYEAAQDEFLQSGVSGLGRDIYRPDPLAAIR